MKRLASLCTAGAFALLTLFNHQNVDGGEKIGPNGVASGIQGTRQKANPLSPGQKTIIYVGK